MSQDWAIALISLAASILVTFFGVIAYELREIRKALHDFVRRDDCRDDMHNHCSRLDELENRVTLNEGSLRELYGQTKVWHG